jgi:hypothetical protein
MMLTHKSKNTVPPTTKELAFIVFVAITVPLVVYAAARWL